jgi:hypothetical protein
MANKDVTFSAAEFKQLPLEFVISAPLMATMAAHEASARTSLAFINSLNEMGNQTFEQEVSVEKLDAQGKALAPTTQKKQISVPMLALAKVPSLNFDSLDIEFEYSINQIYHDEKSKDFSIGVEAGAKGILSGILNVGFKGSFASKKSTENTINKSGTLSVKLHASESGTPEGLNKVINWMVQNIEDNIPPK